MAHQQRRRQGQGSHQFGNVGAIALHGAIRRIAGAGAMAAQVDRHGSMARGEMGDLRVPIRMRTAEAVHEDDGRVAAASADVMDGRHIGCLGVWEWRR